MSRSAFTVDSPTVRVISAQMRAIAIGHANEADRLALERRRIDPGIAILAT
jgi:hypothetical protein